jgi:1-acyl-sn-glycerol-3-phosphate acyltransferase
MKLFKFMPALAVIVPGLRRVKKYIQPIEASREAGNAEEEQKEILAACTEFSEYVAKGLDMHFHVINPENLPEKGPVVYMSNHQSYSDILAFLYVVRNHQIGFIAKEELGKVPMISGWIPRIRGLLIERGDTRSSLTTINQGASYLKEGFSLVIFPEGTRSQGHEMGEFKAGSFKLATKARVPIVPVTLEGGYHFYEETGKIQKGVTIHVMIHPAIDTASLDRSQFADLPKQVEDTVRAGLASLQEREQDL